MTNKKFLICKKKHPSTSKFQYILRSLGIEECTITTVCLTLFILSSVFGGITLNIPNYSPSCKINIMQYPWLCISLCYLFCICVVLLLNDWRFPGNYLIFPALFRHRFIARRGLSRLDICKISMLYARSLLEIITFIF